MAKPITAGDIVLVRHACITPTQVGLNNFYYRATNIVGAPTYDIMLNVIDLLFSTVYRPCIPAAYKRYGTQIRWPLVPADAPLSTGANVLVGTAAGDPLPTQVAGIISKYSDVIGRKGRGRVYIPFPATSFLDTDDTPTAAYVTLLTGIAALALQFWTWDDGAGNTVDMIPICWSNVTPTTGYNVTRHVEKKKWATQRRRGDLGRPNPVPW